MSSQPSTNLASRTGPAAGDRRNRRGVVTIVALFLGLPGRHSDRHRGELELPGLGES